jgi:hypothetical protein
MNRSKLKLLGFFIVVLGVIMVPASLAQASLTVKLVLDLEELKEEKEGKLIVKYDHSILEIKTTGPTWLILNASGTTATELKALTAGEGDSEDLTLLTKLLGIQIAITCTAFELSGFNLEKEGNLTVGGKVKYTGCEIYGKGALTEPLGCKVHTAGSPAGTIQSNKLKGELLLHIYLKGETELVLKIQPEVGETFLTFLTEECIVPESIPFKGIFYLEDALEQITTHAVKHLLEEGSRTSLYLGVHTAEHLETILLGSVWMKLGGTHAGLKWSGMLLE